MPTSKRRRTGPAAATQSTLSFRGDTARVTKAGTAAVKNIKDSKSKSKPEPEHIEHIEHATTTTTTTPPAPVEIALPEPDTVEPEVVEEEVEEAEHPLLTKAHSITPAGLRAYWSAKQAARKAPRVHQEDLSLHEKILREFDLTSRFGPCTGITREKRWWRASALGFEPPVEVLAVLVNDGMELQEEEEHGGKGKKGSGKKAHGKGNGNVKATASVKGKVCGTSVMDRLIDGEIAAA